MPARSLAEDNAARFQTGAPDGPPRISAERQAVGAIHREERPVAVVELSIFAKSLSGKAGSVRFAKTKDGTIMRDSARVNNPKTPAQEAVRSDFTQVTELWQTLTSVQQTQWRSQARLIVKKSKRSGRDRSPSGFNYFTGLTTKYLQINPGGAIPHTPPASAAFSGDTVAVTAVAKTGGILYTADKANAEGVTTELLLQTLRSAGRLPTASDYRSKQFIAFAAGSLSATVAVPAGSYAPAIRFVNPRTGQETAIFPLPVVHVA